MTLSTQLDESFVDNRSLAIEGKISKKFASHAAYKANTGNYVDFYELGTGDKIEGKVTKNDGKEVWIKPVEGKVQKFIVV